MKRALLIAFAALAMLPSSAPAVTLVNPDGSVAQPYQHWADLSRVPTVSDTLTIDTDMSDCDMTFDAVRACIASERGEIHLRDVRCGLFADQPWRKCRYTIMHEIGHQFDFRMPEWKRQRAAAIIGVAPWAMSARGDGGGEAFADLYAMCSMGSQYPIENWFYPKVSARDFRRTCHLIRIPNEKSPASR